MKLAGLLLSLCLLCGCASEAPLVPKEPPPIKNEQAPPKPGTGVFWMSGHWAWKDDSQVFYWVDGTWESERPGWIWFPGEWAPVDDAQGQRQGWRWVPERWLRREEAGLPD